MRQIKFYLKEEEYRALSKLAEEAGVTVPSLAKKIVLSHIGLDESLPLHERVKILEDRLEKLSQEVGRIEKDLAYLIREVKGIRRS